MLASAVVCTVAFVPDVFQLAHGGRLLAIQPVEEAVVDHLTIVSGASCVDPDGSANLLFVRRHDVHKVADGLCGVVTFADVDVDPASAAWAALCACLAEQPDDLLQGFDVVVGEDRGDQFAFFCVRSVDAHIPLEFPNPALLVFASPAVISVLAGCVPSSKTNF